MSLKAMAYVWDTPLKGSQKLMLLAIADRCDDFGECFPGVARLAKKCGVTHSTAQKMLRKLEEAGELIVSFNEGIETGRGKTNRYFLAKYRQSIGLVNPARGIKSDTPSSQGASKVIPVGASKVIPVGASKVIPVGASKVIPNTSVYSSVDTSVKDIAPVPDAIPISDMDDAIYGESKDNLTDLLDYESSEEKSDVAKNAILDPVEEKKKESTEHQQIVAMISAWWDTLPVKITSIKNPYANKTYRGYAKSLIEQGITPDDVKRFVHSRMHDRFWKGKPLYWKKVVDDLPFWLHENPPEDIPDVSVEDLHPHHQEQYAKLAALPDLNIITNPPAPEDITGKIADPEIIKQMMANLAKKFSGDFTPEPEGDNDAA